MEQNNKPALSMFATVQEYKDAVKAFDANLKRRAEDAERLPAEKLVWEAPVVQRQTFAEIMPKREAFIKHCEARGLDTSIEKDAWGAHIFAHSHIQAMWEGWFSATAPATPAPVVVEDVTAADTQWGVSFAGANPEAKDYVACASRAEAERLIAAPAVEAPSQFGSPELQAVILANLAAPAVDAAELDKLATYDPDRDSPGLMEWRDRYNDGDYVKLEDVRALVAQQAARIAELEATERDAKRYRWLRDEKNDVALVIDKRTKWIAPDESVAGVGGYWQYEYRAGEELDAAIDAVATNFTHEGK